MDTETLRHLRRAFEDVIWRMRAIPGACLDWSHTRDLRRVYSMGGFNAPPELEDAGYSMTLTIYHTPTRLDAWPSAETRAAAPHYFRDDPESWYALIEEKDPDALGKAVALALGVEYTTPEALISAAYQLRVGKP